VRLAVGVGSRPTDVHNRPHLQRRQALRARVYCRTALVVLIDCVVLAHVHTADPYQRGRIVDRQFTSDCGQVRMFICVCSMHASDDAQARVLVNNKRTHTHVSMAEFGGCVISGKMSTVSDTSTNARTHMSGIANVSPAH
jgi:hypothetical protein